MSGGPPDGSLLREETRRTVAPLYREYEETDDFEAFLGIPIA